MRQLEMNEGWIEHWAAACVRYLTSANDLLCHEIIPRMGYRGMLAVVLPMAALVQEWLSGWRLFGGAPPPLLACAVLYFVLRFRPARAVEAAAAGSLVAWLAYRGAFLSSGGVLFVSVVLVGLLSHWLYTEFWPAHAVGSLCLTFAGPLAAVIIGARSPIQSVGQFVSTLIVGPMLSALFFFGFEALRRYLGIEVEPICLEAGVQKPEQAVHGLHTAEGTTG